MDPDNESHPRHHEFRAVVKPERARAEGDQDRLEGYRASVDATRPRVGDHRTLAGTGPPYHREPHQRERDDPQQPHEECCLTRERPGVDQDEHQTCDGRDTRSKALPPTSRESAMRALRT